MDSWIRKVMQYVELGIHYFLQDHDYQYIANCNLLHHFQLHNISLSTVYQLSGFTFLQHLQLVMLPLAKIASIFPLNRLIYL